MVWFGLVWLGFLSKLRHGIGMEAIAEHSAKLALSHLLSQNDEDAGDEAHQVATNASEDLAASLKAMHQIWLEHFHRHTDAGTHTGAFLSVCFAQSLDGALAFDQGCRSQISGAASHHWVHVLRGLHDAVLVGSGTLLVDDPKLSVRSPWADIFKKKPLLDEAHTGADKEKKEATQPRRIVLDRRLRTPVDARILRSAGGQVCIATDHGSCPKKAAALQAAGAQIWRWPAEAFAPEGLALALAGEGIGSALIEGGAHILSGFLSDCRPKIDWWNILVSPWLVGHSDAVRYAGAAKPQGTKSNAGLDLRHLKRTQLAPDWIVWGPQNSHKADDAPARTAKCMQPKIAAAPELAGDNLFFMGHGKVVLRHETPPASLAAEDVLVGSLCSALSAGSEVRVAKDITSIEENLDATLRLANSNATGSHKAALGFRYGYAMVGEIWERGAQAEILDLAALSRHMGGYPADAALPMLEAKPGMKVFAFAPHGRFACVPAQQVVHLPADMPAQDAALLASMETALSLAMDVAALPGETVIVLGLGTVGMLLAALLAQTPLGQLVVVEPNAARRKTAEAWLAQRCSALNVAFWPSLEGHSDFQADVAVDVSGNASAVAAALPHLVHAGRFVLGSWFGDAAVALPLGTLFHRRRLRLISSQVSTVGPQVLATFSKARRLAMALRYVQAWKPSLHLCQSLPLTAAPGVYGHLCGQKDAASWDDLGLNPKLPQILWDPKV